LQIKELICAMKTGTILEFNSINVSLNFVRRINVYFGLGLESPKGNRLKVVAIMF